ncbi:MAG: hypothetical protein K0Q91_996 [Fibrobacteria bacterium]|nr:hypothetical protein [Fibrobacteria bacterium]
MNAVFAPVLKTGLSLLAGLPALLLLASCDSANTLTSGDLRGTVTLYVVDVNTNLPLEDVRVDLLGVGSDNTDGGHVNFKDVKAGTYFVRLSRKGYESSQTTITSEAQGSETVVAVNFSGTLGIHKLGAKVRGRLFVRNLKGDSMFAARNAAVNLWSSPVTEGIFLSPVRTVKTDTNGWYTFENLAEYAAYALEVPDFTFNGRTYRQDYQAFDNEPMTASSPMFNAPAITLAPSAGSTLAVYALSTRLAKGQPFVLEFSNPIDTSKLVFSPAVPGATIRLDMMPPQGGGAMTLAPRLIWSADLTKLSIMPYQADWADGARYNVYLSALQDVFGGSVSAAFYDLRVPSTSPLLAAVTNLRLRATTQIRGANFDTTLVDYATTPYRLSWNKVAGAEGYSIYYRQAVDSSWRLSGASVDSDSDTTHTLQLNPPTGKAWTRYLMVLPNSTSRPVPYSLGALMTVRDGVKPSLNTTGSTITAPGGASFNNATATARAITLTLSTVLTGGQNDPIDTTKKPTVRIGNGGVAGTFAAPSFVWTSLTGGTLNVSVPANTNGSGDTVVVDFSAVTDLAGNTFDNLPNAPVLRYLAP